jgi:signal transduction histidine kinase
MDYNIVTSLNCIEETKHILGNNFSLLFYSHLPTAIFSLVVGIFVFIKNKKDLASKLLFSLCLTFSVWLILNLILWISNDSREIVYFWIIVDILDPLFFALSLYFVYVFIDKKDISIIKKIIVGSLFLPLFIMILAKLGVNEFDMADCSGIEGNYFLKYIYFMELVVSFWVVAFLIKRYIKAELEQRKQILILGSGMIFFLLSFFIASYVSEYIVEMGSVYGYRLEFYGNFGITVFLGLLAYLIVKYKAFNIKFIGAQALVYALVILIGSQFFFIVSNTNRILTGITLVLAVGFGIFLIRSVKAEVKRKEELQDMTEKLAVSNDKLRELDNAKSEFISIASHQLRTPLTSIKGYISLITEGTYGKIDEGIAEPLANVYASNERLINLVEDLLNVSRIESGRMEYAFKKCKLEDIIKNLYDTFSVIAKGKGLYLHLNLPENPLPEVEVDEIKTREVISNLIDNALKYTKRGGVTIKAELLNNKEWNVPNAGGKSETLSGDLVKITIADTGMGVPVTELPYLFSKFSRGKDTSRLHVTGTGLGLYVGKNMIEAQHGRIYVESEGAGMGARFIIELPVEQPKG